MDKCRFQRTQPECKIRLPWFEIHNHRQKKIPACVSQQLGSSISAMHFCVPSTPPPPRGPPDCGFHAGLCWGQSLGLRKWYFPHLHSSESPPPRLFCRHGPARRAGGFWGGEEAGAQPLCSVLWSVSRETHATGTSRRSPSVPSPAQGGQD